MLRILSDGLHIFSANLAAIAAFSIAVLGFGLIVVRSIRGIHAGPEMKWLLASGVGPILLVIVTFLLAVVGQLGIGIFHPLSILIIILSAAVVLYELWFLGREVRLFNLAFLLVGIGLGLILILRLAFLRYILLPPYTDSPIHYQIIQEILAPGTMNYSKFTLQNILGNYYHYGFHGLAAWLSSIRGANPLVIMPLLGQIFLVIAMLSIAAFVQTATGNWTASLAAALFAGIGWSMPAYAANWGKYPAILALAVFPAYLAASKYFLSNINKWSQTGWLLTLTIGIELIHTRIAVLIFLAAISYMLTRRFVSSQELTLPQGIRIAFLYGITLAPLYVILANFYRDLPIFILLIPMLPFAFHYNSKISIGVFFYTFFIELIGIIQRILPEVVPNLLNEEFIEMSLYIPLSILGGLGMAGVIRFSKGNALLQRLIPSAAAGVMVFHLFTGITLAPDPCCQLYTEDDQAAFRWFQGEVTDHALVLTSAFKEDQQYFGTDAGIWLFPLTGIQTNKLPYDISWADTDEIDQACRSGAQEIYIYVGGREFSFDKTQLNQAEWVDSVFLSGNTNIFKIKRC